MYIFLLKDLSTRSSVFFDASNSCLSTTINWYINITKFNCKYHQKFFLRYVLGSSQSWVNAPPGAQPYQNQLHPLVS